MLALHRLVHAERMIEPSITFPGKDKLRCAEAMRNPPKTVAKTVGKVISRIDFHLSFVR